MIILGINAYHGDVSAALLREGQLLAAVEEERFRRVKHWAGFPREAIRACLDMAGITPEQVDHFAVSRDPKAHLLRKALFALKHRPSVAMVRDRVRNAGQVQDLADRLRKELVGTSQELGVRSQESGVRRLRRRRIGWSTIRRIWRARSSRRPSRRRPSTY